MPRCYDGQNGPCWIFILPCPFCIHNVYNIYAHPSGLDGMPTPSTLDITRSKPIGKGLDAFRDSLTSACGDAGILCSVEYLGQIDNEGKNYVTFAKKILILR